jgi:hypothetical protein
VHGAKAAAAQVLANLKLVVVDLPQSSLRWLVRRMMLQQHDDERNQQHKIATTGMLVPARHHRRFRD